MKKFIILILSLGFVSIFNTSYASSQYIDANVYRNQEGNGNCFVSSGFPLPIGLVTESMIKKGLIKVIVDNREVPANVTALRGRHNDNSLRSMLIQFEYIMKKNEVLQANIVVNNGVRSFPDPAYRRPTQLIVMNNNVILPSDPEYISTTQIVFQHLLPAGRGNAEEEKQFTALADDRFDHLSVHQHRGTAAYENPKAMAGLWARTGDIKYFNEMLHHIFEFWAGYNFPKPNSGCSDARITNPDNVDWPNHTNSGCWQSGAEWQGPRMQSYATAYLLTGYRDFWGAIAAFAQRTLFQGGQIVDQQTSDDRLITGWWDYPRFNYNRYAPLFSALMIDATIPVRTFWSGAKVDYTDHIQWALNSLFKYEWDVVWIPFDNWDRQIPNEGSIDSFVIKQGRVEAIVMGLYLDTNAARRIDNDLARQDNEPEKKYNGLQWLRPSDNVWFEWDAASSTWRNLGVFPASGYLQVSKSSISGGMFTLGPLSEGLNAHIHADAIVDYRNGLVGVRSNGFKRESPIPVFQTVFPANFLIDYYLNIHADERIPKAIYEMTRIVLMNVRAFEKNDRAYNSGSDLWGRVTHGHNYNLEFPIRTDDIYHYILPEYARLIAFVIKTMGDLEVNGKLLSEWYSVCVNSANNSHLSNVGGLIWEWKLFGQYYGLSQDAPWMMAQESLIGFGPTTIRKPTRYDAIPGDTPDIARE
ncbi:MAG: hypothetical protein Q7J24_07805 [Desulfomicrobium sp.]|nr:hypothetical protein [Desulfomicrobium sp.]